MSGILAVKESVQDPGKISEMHASQRIVKANSDAFTAKMLTKQEVKSAQNKGSKKKYAIYNTNKKSVGSRSRQQYYEGSGGKRSFADLAGKKNNIYRPKNAVARLGGDEEKSSPYR